MGQYYIICNLDKREFLHPHEFGDGLKLMEFGWSGCSTMTGLAILLAEGNGRGGGDLRSDNPIIGRWARDRIVVAGDYADDEPGKPEEMNMYTLATREGSEWLDVSRDVIDALMDDEYVRADMIARETRPGTGYACKTDFDSVGRGVRWCAAVRERNAEKKLCGV